MKCKICGKNNCEDSAFCAYCGNQLKNEKSESIGIECIKCGNVNSLDAVFCEECGNKLENIHQNSEKCICPKCCTENHLNSKFCNQCGELLNKDNIYAGYSYEFSVEKSGFQTTNVFCPECGNKVEFGSRYCTECGHQMIFFDGSIYENDDVEEECERVIDNNMLVWKILFILGSLVGLIVSGITIYSDTRQKETFWGYTYQEYTYSTPFSEHEIGMITLLIVSIIILVIGCCLPLYKNKD